MDYVQDRNGPRKRLLVGVLILELTLPVLLLAGEAERKPSLHLAGHGEFTLRIQKNLISLKAQEASLRAILAEISHKMRIEVVGEIPAEDTLTAEFHHLRLEQALNSLSPNYGYQMKTDEGQQRIAKIFVLPKRMESAVPRREVSASQTVTSSPLDSTRKCNS